ncbi:hypothetical protein RND71_035090 [Anisodus tanguticus]|uniref:Cyclin C-terminal domain-containing protein n=1 Tax=Anisodus tanguticus TaxID=243964 RepID=A0AAE1R521_9SOLA|nr:hypothetical protein RND71_035090 [Anisodus tanguticus]
MAALIGIQGAKTMLIKGLILNVMIQKSRIVDVDAADVNNELAVLEYVEDIYSYCKIAEFQRLMCFIKAAVSDAQTENIVYVLAELGLMNYATNIYCPSMIAASAVYAA